MENGHNLPLSTRLLRAPFQKEVIPKRRLYERAGLLIISYSPAQLPVALELELGLAGPLSPTREACPRSRPADSSATSAWERATSGNPACPSSEFRPQFSSRTRPADHPSLLCLPSTLE